MPVKKIVDQLLKSKDFKDWSHKKGHKQFYLAHVFKMFDEPNENIYEVGYFDAKHEKMTTFVIEADKSYKIKKIDISAETEIFKKPDSTIKELKTDKIKTDLPTALETAKDFQKKEYPQQLPIKQFLILQNLEMGIVYNITFVTQTFKTLNIKVSAEDGKILKHELISLMDFKADK